MAECDFKKNSHSKLEFIYPFIQELLTGITKMKAKFLAKVTCKYLVSDPPDRR
jgi:hypothetical protein